MNSLLAQRTRTRRWVGQGRRGTLSGYQITVSADVQDTCRILGSGDDEQIKARLHWFATFYPAIYSEVIDRSK